MIPESGQISPAASLLRARTTEQCAGVFKSLFCDPGILVHLQSYESKPTDNQPRAIQLEDSSLDG